jgi:hypothetical protein
MKNVGTATVQLKTHNAHMKKAKIHTLQIYVEQYTCPLLFIRLGTFYEIIRWWKEEKDSEIFVRSILLYATPFVPKKILKLSIKYI